jgi:hypothetical protein
VVDRMTLIAPTHKCVARLIKPPACAPGAPAYRRIVAITSKEAALPTPTLLARSDSCTFDVE